METCLCCRGLKTLPGMGMMGTRKCDACDGRGKVESQKRFETAIYTENKPKETVIYHPAQTSPMEDSANTTENPKLDPEPEKKKAGRPAKNKFSWTS